MSVQADISPHTVTAGDHARSAPATSATAPYVAEFVGTFILVFAITATAIAAALNHPIAGGAFGSLALPLVNGIVLAALVAGLGHVSGAHFNPAVTIAMAAIGRFPWRQVPGFVLVQLAGGVLAGLATWAIGGGAARTVAHLGANAPAPGVSNGQALLAEALITFVLVFVVTAVATDSRVPAGVAPFAVGSALAAAVFIGGPLTGAAVNPARALGPMIAAGSFTGWWIFLLGPVVGGLVAAVLYDRLIRRGAPSPA
jgi:MIP family channel proteins